MPLSSDPVARGNQLANLIPGKFGEVRNPTGRPKKSLYVSEAMRMLSDADEDELRKVASDTKARAALRIAANRYLDALNGEGKEALANSEFLADRLEGKPTQVQRIETDIEPPKRIIVHAPEPPKSLTRNGMDDTPGVGGEGQDET